MLFHKDTNQGSSNSSNTYPKEYAKEHDLAKPNLKILQETKNKLARSPLVDILDKEQKLDEDKSQYDTLIDVGSKVFLFLLCIILCLFLISHIVSLKDDLLQANLGDTINSLNKAMHISKRDTRYDFNWMSPEDFEDFISIEDFTPSTVDIDDTFVTFGDKNVSCTKLSTIKGGTFNKYYGNIEYVVKAYKDSTTNEVIYKEGEAFINSSEDNLRAMCALLNIERDSELYNAIDYGYSIDIKVPVEINNIKYIDHQVIESVDGKLRLFEEYELAG